MFDIKEFLAGKITEDSEKLRMINTGYMPQSLDLEGTRRGMPWWLRREYLRIELGVYPETTDVLTKLNKHNVHHAFHVSKEDPSLVAFTLDRTNGEQDRQLRTTLGRAIAKIWPTWPDSYVQELSAQHAAEVNCEVEFITGEAITGAYLSTAGTGAAACMSREVSEYGGKHHPTVAYHAPNIAMAVLRNKAGSITERCMVFTPTEKDKRYIRCYPSNGVLVKRLKRKGYVSGGWNGAVFNKVPGPEVGEGLVSFCMPYLDCNGTTGGPEGSSLAYMGGELIGVSGDMYRKLRVLDNRLTVCSTNTAGWITLLPVESQNLEGTCDLTGKVYHTLIAEVSNYFDPITRTVKVALEEALLAVQTAENSPWREVIVMVDDDLTQRWLMDTTGMKLFTEGGMPQYEDTKEMRIKRGYQKLDPVLYPETSGWYKTYELVVDAKGRYIKKEDAISVVYEQPDGAGVIVGAIHAATTDVKKLIKLHPRHDGDKLYVLEGHEGLVRRTATGKKVVPVIHSVIKLWDDTWDFTRNAKEWYFINQKFHLSKADYRELLSSSAGLPALRMHAAYAVLKKEVGNGLRMERSVHNVLRRGWEYGRVDGRSLYSYPDFSVADFMSQNVELIRSDFSLQALLHSWGTLDTPEQCEVYGVQPILAGPAADMYVYRTPDGFTARKEGLIQALYKVEWASPAKAGAMTAMMVKGTLSLSAIVERSVLKAQENEKLLKEYLNIPFAEIRAELRAHFEDMYKGLIELQKQAPVPLTNSRGPVFTTPVSLPTPTPTSTPTYYVQSSTTIVTTATTTGHF